ncbi:MAG: response regulator [Desulfotignum sp.]|nr:response regulator [Desulfotignum sp.]
MKPRNLSISTQLKLCLGAILVIVLFLGAAAWIQMGLIWKDTGRLYRHPLTVSRAIGELKADIIAMHWKTDDLFSQNNTRNQKMILSHITNLEADIQKNLEILINQYLGPRIDIYNLMHGLTESAHNRKKVLQLLKKGETDKARAENYYNQNQLESPHMQEMMNLVEIVSDFAGNKADELYGYAAKHKKNLTYQLAGIIAVIFFVTAGIGVFLYVQIRRPLRELTRATDRFRNGDLHVRSRYVSANELGRLSAVFNQMAQTVSLRIDRETNNTDMAKTLIMETEPQKFAQTVLKKIMDITGSDMGAFYLWNREDACFSPLAGIGVNTRLLEPFDGSVFEGEFGRALTSKTVSHIRNIPEDTAFTFKTFTGTAVPKEIITLPIVVDEKVQAMISLACLKKYSDTALAFLSQPLHIALNTAFANILANDKTRRLSEQLQQTNEELRIQQEELELQSEELQEQNVELEQQRLAVEEASRLKSAFLSNISHELRTPLNSVMALSRVLMMQAGEKLSQEEVNYLEIIERNGKNLLTLINEILDLSKIEAGRMDVHPQPFSLSRTLENILENIAPLAEEKQISLAHNIPEDLPMPESDEIRVTQILQNLLANAVKFTDKGGVTVTVTADQKDIAVQIADTGIGISQKHLPYIFDEFRQADESSSRQHEGSGLGLAIAHKAARMLGGDITVESTPEKGSTFTVTLPLNWQGTAPVYEPVTAADPAGDDTRPTSLENLSALKILLVEDNDEAIVQIKAILENTGYTVDVAHGGQAAVDYIQHTLPDGIILDLMMPQVDGFAVLEKIRGTPATANIPVLVLTAKDLTPHDFKRLSSNNIQQLVQKGDVDQQSLLEKIKSMLGELKG